MDQQQQHRHLRSLSSSSISSSCCYDCPPPPGGPGSHLEDLAPSGFDPGCGPETSQLHDAFHDEVHVGYMTDTASSISECQLDDFPPCGIDTEDGMEVLGVNLDTLMGVEEVEREEEEDPDEAKPDRETLA